MLLTFWFKRLKGQSYMICEPVWYIWPSFDHTSDIFFLVLHLYETIIWCRSCSFLFPINLLYRGQLHSLIIILLP
jgi:hypothetical protein